MPLRSLGIEKALERSGGSFIDKYRLMKDRLLNVEYEHWAAGFPEGNNHGRGHITRVLENLDYLLGPRPLAHLDPYELFLTMMSVLYHDIGLLRQRKGHEDISKALLEGDVNDAYIINAIDKELIAAAVVSHSSSKDIGYECSRFSSEEIIGKHKARPAVIAALVRLADELDEDHRRADAVLQNRLKLPIESTFYWLFCQRVRGIRPNLTAKRIDFNFAPETSDTTTYGPVPGGRIRHFIAFCAEKLAKINDERVTVNRHLPSELQYSGIHVDVKPLPKHPRWKSPRTFVFNDSTTSLMFLQSFPELLDEPASMELKEILELMKGRELSKAEKRLEQLASVRADLAVETQMRILYDQACLSSMKAEDAGDPATSDRLLDQAAQYLIEWFTQGKNGAFDATGRTASAEVHRMATDGDLSLVRRTRRSMLRKAIPEVNWPTSSTRGGGCVPRGTLIDTPRGSRPVELLHEGDEVISLRCCRSGYARVTTRVASVKSGRTTSCVQLNQCWLLTPRQPVRTAAGWVDAESVKVGDEVVDGNGAVVKVRRRRLVQAYFEIFQLSIEPPYHNYIADNLLCHNPKK